MKITDSKVWMKYYEKENWDILLPECTAYAYLRATNKHRMHRTAIHYYGKDITFRELFAMIDEAANAFTALGVKRGDMVSFLSVGTPETIASLYALNKMGATVNTIDPRMDTASIARMIKSSGSKMLLTIDVAFPKVAKIMDEINQEKIITVSPATSLPFIKKVAMKIAVKTKIEYSNKVLKWDDFLAKGKNTIAEEAPYVGDAVVAITYTGGTTGFPKGVMLTNDSMNAVVINFMHCGIEYNHGDRFLGIIPIFSSYGMVCGTHMPLCMNLELVPIPKFDPTSFGKLVKTFRPQHMISTPAFYELLMQSREVKNLDLSFLSTLGSGGDTMNAGLEKKLSEFMRDHNMSQPLAQGYGMSELSAAASFCVGKIHKPGSVGIPSLTTTVSIFDPETGEELGYGEEGEICVTGPTMMKGYFNNPEETAYVMRLHDDGQIWIHSGDVGYIDDDGFIFIKGRIKRMITRFDGHKVFPVNLEASISSREDVHNCAVVGINDREHAQGQYPIAIVEFAEGVDREAACREIFKYCDENVEERGKPVAVIAVDEIPLTGMGKNDCRNLEKEYANYDYLAWQANN
ncbi:MAG: acyl--CoA ligase [Clostridia bacterium]|nr:acyl--CoA ligase [Clostridia bacterium]